MRLLAFVTAVSVCSTAVSAQRPIQDNSFLIEEAYNQERGVVQHISTFQRDLRGSGFLFTFTQEWPVGSQKHQLSYTPSFTRPSDGSAGFGDTRLNYRYQLVGSGETRVAVSPRLTAILPTGDWKHDRGAGGAGVEGWLPVSIVLDDALVGHLNAGLTYIPNARREGGATSEMTTLAAGGSLIWLARPRFNVMLEAIHFAEQNANGSTTISPGIRWSYDFKSGLQIVPGLAFPIEFTNGTRQRSVFLYLSFEHPFTKEAKSGS
jgi:hypothetical protein